MDAIFIPNLLKISDQRQSYDLQERFADLETLMPINGRLQVIHHGNFLEVTAIAEAIVTLVCDRCLQQYNHRLQLNVSELIWLEESRDLEPNEDNSEVEIPMEDLVETLPPQGYFAPDEWLYEQLCLALPQRQLCDDACVGIIVEQPQSSELQPEPIDQRWASLQTLKENLLN
ncbi:MAG: DUF177 domain-containing protein [Symploca sp. SIO2B6]|nr:DUF177 domain-containing protein [Symploca sp. SIO2B6]